MTNHVFTSDVEYLRIYVPLPLRHTKDEKSM